MDEETEHVSKTILFKHRTFFRNYIEKYEDTVYHKHALIFKKLLKAIESDKV